MADKTPYRTDNLLTKRQEYELIKGALMLERAPFDLSWRELADYILPQRVRFFLTDRNRNDRRNTKIIDSTGTFAARTLRSGMHAGLTSPARPWMRLLTPDPELDEFGPVKEWLHTVTQRMRTVFSKSNLYNALPIVYGDMGVFASSAMSVLEDDRDLFRCYAYPIGSFALGMSSRQVVDTCVREYPMTVRQVVTEFALDRQTNTIDWSNLSITVRNLWDRAAYESVIDVCWVVAPNPDRDDTKLESKYLPFYSCHFEKGQGAENKFLRERGFHEFPIMAPRWDVTGEDIYGTDCPGMTSRGDIKALQVMQKRKAQAIEKGVNPSVQAPTSLRQKGVSLIAGDVNYVDVREQHQGIRATHEVNMNVADITADINDTRFLIRRSFYEDLFLMLATMDNRQPVTAREIDERHEEKLLALGPVLERTNDELLDPLVDRVYAMMERAGMIPEPPQELQGVDLKVEYISLMAQAQKLVGVVSLDRFFSSTVQLIPTFPEMRFKIRAMQAVDDYGEALGVNPKLVVPDDEAQRALAAEQKAQQQAQQAALAAQGSQTAKNLGQVDMSGDNALKRIAEGVVA